MSFQFFGLSFHMYGLILGLSLMMAFWLIEKKARQINFNPYSNKHLSSKKYSDSIFWYFVFGAFIGGVLGARIWHVFTDFSIYKNSLINSLYIWKGGLSILGGILGGVIGIAITVVILNKKFHAIENKENNNKKQFSKVFKTVLDLTVFGLPFAQAVGRLANYINQELYGLPTNLPWGININLANRIAGFEEYTRFHPLFLYEGIAMFSFGIFIWWWNKKQNENELWKIGSGRYALLYILYYSGVRFLLEFIRIDKSMMRIFGGDIIGVNQFVMLLVFVLMSVLWFYKIFKNK